MGAAKHVRDADWNGNSKVYQIDGARHVVVSVIETHQGPMTFLFDANDDGTLPISGDAVQQWGGALDHEDALQRAGHHVEGAQD